MTSSCTRCGDYASAGPPGPVDMGPPSAREQVVRLEQERRHNLLDRASCGAVRDRRRPRHPGGHERGLLRSEGAGWDRSSGRSRRFCSSLGRPLAITCSTSETRKRRHRAGTSGPSSLLGSTRAACLPCDVRLQVENPKHRSSTDLDHWQVAIPHELLHRAPGDVAQCLLGTVVRDEQRGKLLIRCCLSCNCRHPAPFASLRSITGGSACVYLDRSVHPPQPTKTEAVERESGGRNLHVARIGYK